MVHGIQGKEPKDLVEWKENRHSSRDQLVSFSFSPSKIIGKEFSETSLETEARNLLDTVDTSVRLKL